MKMNEENKTLGCKTYGVLPVRKQFKIYCVHTTPNVFLTWDCNTQMDTR